MILLRHLSILASSLIAFAFKERQLGFLLFIVGIGVVAVVAFVAQTAAPIVIYPLI